jgi:hypothetical protein
VRNQHKCRTAIQVAQTLLAYTSQCSQIPPPSSRCCCLETDWDLNLRTRKLGRRLRSWRIRRFPWLRMVLGKMLWNRHTGDECHINIPIPRISSHEMYLRPAETSGAALHAYSRNKQYEDDAYFMRHVHSGTTCSLWLRTGREPASPNRSSWMHSSVQQDVPSTALYYTWHLSNPPAIGICPESSALQEMKRTGEHEHGRWIITFFKH